MTLAAEQPAAEMRSLVRGDADALIGNRQHDVILHGSDPD